MLLLYHSSTELFFFFQTVAVEHRKKTKKMYREKSDFQLLISYHDQPILIPIPVIQGLYVDKI